MDTIGISGSWSEQKDRLKKRFAILMDSDLIIVDGKKVEMFAKLQLRLGKTKEELDNIMAGL
jgi:uncharacterized protein YjbJ (UPF0337 family)